MRRLLRIDPPDPTEDRPANHPRTNLQGAQPEIFGVGAEGAREVVAVGLEPAVLARLGGEHLLEAAGLARALGVGMCEEPLLERQRCRRLGGRRIALSLVVGAVGGARLAAG